MEAKCINCSSPREVLCYCRANPTPLCSNCVAWHFGFDSKAGHTVKPSSPETPKVLNKSNVPHIRRIDSLWSSFFGGCCKPETESHFEITQTESKKPKYFQQAQQTKTDSNTKTPRNALSVEVILSDLEWNLKELDDLRLKILDSKVKIIRQIEQEVSIILEDISLLEEKIRSDIELISQSPSNNQNFAERAVSFYRNYYDFPISSKFVNYKFDAEPVMAAISSMYSFSMNSLHDSVIYLKPDTHQMSAYNIPTRLASTVFISSSTPFLPQSSYASVCYNVLFLCGGIQADGYSNCAAFLNSETACCIELPPMNVRRARPGLCILNNVIYIFGGFNGAYLKSSEKFNISTKSWEILPDMLEARAAVTACSVGSSIYLTGGFSISIEVFHPFLDPPCYTKLPFSITVQCTEGLMFSYNDEILILNHDKVFQLDLLTNNLRQIDSIPYKCWWSSNGVINYQKEACFLQGDGVFSYGKKGGIVELFKFK